jgi:hypothetical protein
MFGLGVVISTIFKILGHFLFQEEGGRGMGPPRMVMTYIQSDTRIKDMNGLGVVISMVFKILGHFLLKGGLDHPIYGHDLYTIRNVP